MNRLKDRAVAGSFNKWVDTIIEQHHFAWMMVDPDNTGPKGGKAYIYVCSCSAGFSERKNFALHQAEELHL